MRYLSRFLLCSVPLFLVCTSCRTVPPPSGERIIKLHYAQDICTLGCYKKPLVLEGELQLKQRPSQFVISRINGKERETLFRSHPFLPAGQPVSFQLNVSQQLPLKGCLTVETGSAPQTSTFFLLPEHSGKLCKAVTRNTGNGPVDSNMITLDYTQPSGKPGVIIDAESKTSVLLSFEVHPVIPAENAAGIRE